MSKRSGKPLRLLIAVIFVLVGGLITNLDVHGAAWKLLAINLGLSFIVAGVINIFHLAIHRMESEESAEFISERLLEKLQKHLPLTRGIRLAVQVRKNNDDYYNWVNASGHPDLFFAGRSVLHRIDYDMRHRGKGSAEKILAARLRVGATIRILFLDPRSQLVERLANEAGQPIEAMLADIATSLGICHRLYRDYLHTGKFSSHSRLEIRVYDETPYFAYHKQDGVVLVGFYFNTTLGQDSAAFEVIDPETQKFFSDHFAKVFSHGSRLLELLPHRAGCMYDEQIVQSMTCYLEQKLGQELVAELIGEPRK